MEYLNIEEISSALGLNYGGNDGRRRIYRGAVRVSESIDTVGSIAILVGCLDPEDAFALNECGWNWVKPWGKGCSAVLVSMEYASILNVWTVSGTDHIHVTLEAFSSDEDFRIALRGMGEIKGINVKLPLCLSRMGGLFAESA